MNNEYETYDLAQITREAHLMRDRAIKYAFAYVWRSGKNLVLSLGQRAADSARKITSHVDHRAQRPQ